MEDTFRFLADIGVIGLLMWILNHFLSKSANKKFEEYKAELNKSKTENQLILDSKSAPADL